MKKWMASTVIASTLLLTPLQAFANIGDQTLWQGQNHSDVRQLQQLLKNKGSFTYSGSLTTYFGTNTAAAVKSFQKSHGLVADGIVGKNTYNALGVYKVNNESLINYAKTLIGIPYQWGGKQLRIRLFRFCILCISKITRYYTTTDNEATIR